MTSIRVRLLVSLIALFALAAAAMASITYRNVLAETEALFDYQLQQMALSLRDQGEIASAEARTFADEQLDFVIQIWTVDGRSIYASRPHPALPARALLGLATLNVDGHAWRTFSVATRERVIQVAQPIEIRQRLAARAAWRSILPLLLMAPIAAVVVGWLAARNLAPLERLASEVRARGGQSMAPLGVAGLPDEVAPLALSLNALLERLRTSLDTQRAFVADAAHELRSPLTALKLQLELLRRAGSDADRNASREALAAGIERASRLVEQLLALALADEARAGLRLEPVALNEVARSVLLRYLPKADAAHADLGGEGLDEPVTVLANAALIEGILGNLLDNALRYGKAGHPRITVSVALQQGVAVLAVTDNGPGLSEKDAELLRHRWTLGPAGHRLGEGAGLGLAIVSRYAELLGARFSLDAVDADTGLRATVTFTDGQKGVKLPDG